MKDALLIVLAVVLIVCPYALITLGVFMITGSMGWALVTLGALILMTVLVVGLVANR